MERSFSMFSYTLVDPIPLLLIFLSERPVEFIVTVIYDVIVVFRFMSRSFQFL
jgi:hypothetical protein